MLRFIAVSMVFMFAFTVVIPGYWQLIKRVWAGPKIKLLHPKRIVQFSPIYFGVSLYFYLLLQGLDSNIGSISFMFFLIIVWHILVAFWIPLIKFSPIAQRVLQGLAVGWIKIVMILGIFLFPIFWFVDYASGVSEPSQPFGTFYESPGQAEVCGTLGIIVMNVIIWYTILVLLKSRMEKLNHLRHIAKLAARTPE